MKKIFLLSALLILGTVALYAQCNPYYNLEEGSIYEITSYDNKDKVSGKTVSKIVNFESTSDGWKALIDFKTYDKKDKLILENDDVEMSCANGVIEMDMQRFMPAQMIESFKEMNFQMDIDNIQLPSELNVGDQLDNGSITMTGDIPMTISIQIENRKVEAKESITTPAGTFECYKISYDVNMKTVMNQSSKGIEWIAKDVGVVKSESYNGRGKLMGYSVLTKFE